MPSNEPISERAKQATAEVRKRVAVDSELVCGAAAQYAFETGAIESIIASHITAACEQMADQILEAANGQLDYCNPICGEGKCWACDVRRIIALYRRESK